MVIDVCNAWERRVVMEDRCLYRGEGRREERRGRSSSITFVQYSILWETVARDQTSEIVETLHGEWRMAKRTADWGAQPLVGWWSAALLGGWGLMALECARMSRDPVSGTTRLATIGTTCGGHITSFRGSRSPSGTACSDTQAASALATLAPRLLRREQWTVLSWRYPGTARYTLRWLWPSTTAQTT